MKKYFSFFSFTTIIVLLLCACHSDEYYRDSAAEDAREYILTKMDKISLKDRSYIRYTYPKILTEPLFVSMYQKYNQQYFAWDLPDENITVLVFGVGYGNFRYWEPSRILLKNYKSEDYTKVSKGEREKQFSSSLEVQEKSASPQGFNVFGSQDDVVPREGTDRTYDQNE